MTLKRTKTRVRMLLKVAKSDLKDYLQAVADQEQYIQMLEAELENWEES